MKLIALTGYGQSADMRQAREAGFDLHLVKPVEPARLDEALARSAPSPSNAERARRAPFGVAAHREAIIAPGEERRLMAGKRGKRVVPVSKVTQPSRTGLTPVAVLR